MAVRVAVGAAGEGPYRMRGAADVAWPSQSYTQRETAYRKLLQTGLAAVRLIVPVILLLIVLSAICLYLDAPLPYLADASGEWLSVSHLLLPLAFFALHLTNRRYGPAYAFAQLMLAMSVLVGIAAFGAHLIHEYLPLLAVPEMRVAGAFGLVFFFSSFLGIVAFDALRGPRWWTAPLTSSLVSAIFFAAIFYPMAYMGETLWLEHMFLHMGVLAGAGLLLLVPYWVLRGAVPPLPGFGGY